MIEFQSDGLNTLELLAKRLAKFGTDHPTVPGIQIAWLGETWYVALHIYKEKGGRGREVLASTKNPILGLCVSELLQQVPVPLDE